MTSAVSEALDWLKGSKYGYKFKDKIVLFLYILNATIILIFTNAIFGKNKTLELYFHKSLLLNWMPFKSVVRQSGNREEKNTTTTTNDNHDSIKHKYRADNKNNTPLATVLPPTTTTTTPQAQGFNATFWNATVPFCWYTVNAPPCYDTTTGTIR